MGWEPPPVEWIALNTDSASKNNPGMAGGGVFRGWRGKCVGGYIERMSLCSSVRAELRSVLPRLLSGKE